MQINNGEIRKNKTLHEKGLTNIIKDSKNFFESFRNKKQKNSIGPLHEEGDIIITDIEIKEILNN